MELIISELENQYKINDERYLYVHYSLFPHLLVNLSFEFFFGWTRKLFLQNGYPSGMFDYNINDVLNRQENRPEQPTTRVYKKKGPLNSILFRVTEQNPHQTTEGLHQ